MRNKKAKKKKVKLEVSEAAEGREEGRAELKVVGETLGWFVEFMAGARR